MVRDVAGYDPSRYDGFGNIAIAELLKAYEHRVVERTVDAFRHDQLIAALCGTKDKKPVPVPPILRRLGLVQ